MFHDLEWNAHEVRSPLWNFCRVQCSSSCSKHPSLCCCSHGTIWYPWHNSGILDVLPRHMTPKALVGFRAIRLADMTWRCLSRVPLTVGCLTGSQQTSVICHKYPSERGQYHLSNGEKYLNHSKNPQILSRVTNYEKFIEILFWPCLMMSFGLTSWLVLPHEIIN